MLQTTCTTEELHEIFSDVATAAHMARQYLVAYQQMVDRLLAMQRVHADPIWREELLRHLMEPPLALAPRNAHAILDALEQTATSPEMMTNLARWAEARHHQRG